MSQAGSAGGMGGGGAGDVTSFTVQAGTTSITPTAGVVTVDGAVVAAGSTPVQTFGTSPSTFTTQVQRAQAIASTNAANVGLAAFNSAEFSVDANGFVSLSNSAIFAYTTVNHSQSPYTVLSTDDYISVDPSAGVVTITLPNAPTTFRTLIIKDRTGAASTNNISITTVGGTVTIDGQTTFKLVGNYGAIQLLFNGTSYEIF